MSKDKTNQKGITLIALVITIIVMLILVGVSVTVALNGGLFTTAKEAAEGTASKRNEELELSSGKVEINGEWYNSIDEYVNGSGNEAGEQKVTIVPKKETYTIGEAVTIGEESFYVIADDTEKVTLLAKDSIVVDESSEDYLKQSASATEGKIAFSSTNYWSTETEYPLNLNDYSIPEGVTTPALTAAKTYGTNLGGTGRLMTYEEATALETVNSDILYGTNGKSSSWFLNYWLATASNSSCLYFVYGAQPMMYAPGYENEELAGSWEVRPVVEISKSSIS